MTAEEIGKELQRRIKAVRNWVQKCKEKAVDESYTFEINTNEKHKKKQ